MSLDGNDGSDMELDSDTCPERYYSHGSTVATYNQCPKPLNYSNTDENKDGSSKLLDNGKEDVTTLHSPSSSSQPSNNRNDYINEFDTKSPINSMLTSNIPPQQLSIPFNLQVSQQPLPKNTTNILSQPLSSSSTSEITSAQSNLALNTTTQSQQPMSDFSFKYLVDKSSKRDNVSNGPTPLEKRDKIRFELKSINRLVGKRSVNPNMSAQNVSDANSNKNKKNAYNVTTSFVKSLSLSAVFNSLIGKDDSQKDKSECNDSDKQVTDDNPKRLAIGNNITVEKERELHKQMTIDNSSRTVKENTVEAEKDQNRQQIHDSSSHLVRENSIIAEKILDQKRDHDIDNNSTELLAKNSSTEEKGSDQRVVIVGNSTIDTKKDQVTIDDNITALVKNSGILKEGQDQNESQIDDDNSKIQETNIEIIQKEQVKYVKERHQQTNIPLQLDFIQDVTGNKSCDVAVEINKAIDIDNDDDKDIDYPNLLMINAEEDKNNLMELDQASILLDQVCKNDNENTTDIMEKSGDASSEKKEIEMKNDKLEQHTSKIKDKGKKLAILDNNVVKPTNQAVASSSKIVEIAPQDQAVETTSHIDHLTNLMTQFTNQINQTSRKVNQYNSLESQSNHITTSQVTLSNVMQSTRQINQPDNQENQNAIEPQSISQTIDATELSNEVIEKYYELDTVLLEFDKVAKKAVNAYDDLYKLLPEGTVIKIDPPTTYKWDIITSMFGITDVNKLERYSTISEDDFENKEKNNSDMKKAGLGNENRKQAVKEETLSEAEFDDDDDVDVPSDDPDDKNFKCRSTILKQPNSRMWHNTRSNKPPSANLRQRTVDPDSSNISTTSITSNSSSKKKQSQATLKRTLRIRKEEDEEDSDATTNSQKHLDLDKYYEDGKPRRPANGFSFFCGDMCAKVRNEKLPIKGTIAYAAEVWNKMTEEEKKPWLERGEKSKNEYQELLNKWKEEQEELRSSNVKKRIVSPKVKYGSSSKKPRND